ncbi:MAG TPA: methylthioribulose 1-phosphate dehydratase, partial [Stenomitos sp.]
PTLIAHAQGFYRQGWMWGTAGNLSARLLDSSFWITASGCAKGELTPHQFVRLSVAGELLEQPALGAKPSAEASIHQAIYQSIPEAQACYHVHSVDACVVSEWSQTNSLPLPAIEMIKGLGIWDENPCVELALFPNHHHVPHIAADILARFQVQPPQVPACLIRGHGITVWGNSPTEARNRIEAIEFIFQYMTAARR